MQIKKVLRYVAISAFTLLIMMSCSEDKNTSHPNSKQLDVANKKEKVLQLLSIKTLPSSHSFVVSDSVFSFSELITDHFIDSIVDKEFTVYYQLKSGRYLPIVLGPKAGLVYFTPLPTCCIQVLDSTHFLFGNETAIDQKIDFNAFFDDEKECLRQNNLMILDNYGEKMNWGRIFEDLVLGFDSFNYNNADFTKIPKIIIEHKFSFL